MNKQRAIRHLNRRIYWMHLKHEIREHFNIIFVTGCLIGAWTCKELGDGTDSFFYEVARWIVLTFTI